MTRHSLVPLLAQLADAGTVFIAAILAFYLRFDAEVPVLSQQYHAYLFCILFGVLLNVFVATAMGAYRNRGGTGLGDVLTPLLLAWGATALALVVLLFALKASEAFSRLWFGSWVLLAAVLLTLERMVLLRVLHYLRSKGLNRKRVVLVGFSEQIPELLQRLKKADWAGYEVVALFLPQGKEAVVPDVPVRRDLAALDSFVREHEVMEVWLTCPLREEAFLQEVLWLLRHSTVNIRYLPDLFALRLINHGVSEVMGFPMLDLSASPMTGVNRLVKAVEDRVLAAIILLLISPLMLVIALAVKLTSPGPVFYRQRRHGLNGKIFTIYKFRTMVLHQENEGKVTQARRNDPRLTPIGGFLRRTSLDELPQFINVLKGEMSIVGPRPHAIEHNNQFMEIIEFYIQRHKVKPGITGWAQVNGYRGETDTIFKMQKRIEYDLYYIEHWSLWFDLKIIFLTVFKGLVHPNAY